MVRFDETHSITARFLCQDDVWWAAAQEGRPTTRKESVGGKIKKRNSKSFEGPRTMENTIDSKVSNTHAGQNMKEAGKPVPTKGKSYKTDPVGLLPLHKRENLFL